MSEPPASSNAPSSSRWLTRGVLGIGLASLFSDWGHEAATSLLPAFLASLGAPAVALGIIEGVADGFSSFAKLAGGWLADRPHARKPTGILGYVTTAIATCGYAFATSWPAILVLRSLGWIGRGSRGPSRDALLADAVVPEKIGSAFGFERAMDTVGAVLGPLCATALVGLWGVRGVLKATVVPGLLAALAFATLVPASRKMQNRRAPSFAKSLKQFSPRYWKYLDRRSRARPRRFRANIVNSPRLASSDAAIRRRPRCSNFRWASTHSTISLMPSPPIPPAPSATNSASALYSAPATLSAQ